MNYKQAAKNNRSFGDIDCQRQAGGARATYERKYQRHAVTLRKSLSWSGLAWTGIIRTIPRYIHIEMNFVVAWSENKIHTSTRFLHHRVTLLPLVVIKIFRVIQSSHWARSTYSWGRQRIVDRSTPAIMTMIVIIQNYRWTEIRCISSGTSVPGKRETTTRQMFLLHHLHTLPT